jgi:DNA-binding NarL/FixJ family response regulator
MKPISVLLADDHVLVRQALGHLLLTFEKFSVVGEAGDGIEAIAMTEKHKPDILILDIAMPRMRGLEALRDLKRTSPETRILILSMHNRDEYVRQAFSNGADGYLLKESAAEELFVALNHLSQGEIYLSPAISRNIVKDWLREDKDKQVPIASKADLSDRERMVLKLIAEGLSNKQVAETLHISSKTVETHRMRIMEKLNLRGLPDLVKYAIREGFVDLEK